MTWEIETVYTLDDTALFAEMNSIGWNDFFWKEITDTEDPGYAQYQDNASSYTVPGDATTFEEIQFDLSVDPIPAWENVKTAFFSYVDATHKAEMAATDITGALFKLDPTLTKTLIRGGWLDSEVEPAKPDWSAVRAMDTRLKAVALAYKTMSDNIALAVYNLFQTTDENSANAFAQSWRIKAERGIDYAGEGLLARAAIAGFLVGDPLDTAQKVTDYYSAMVDELVIFDKYRDAQIGAYLAAKTAAEA